MDMFWFNWISWRRKYCYWFRTCGRCLKPLLKKKPLCNNCKNFKP